MPGWSDDISKPPIVSEHTIVRWASGIKEPNDARALAAIAMLAIAVIGGGFAAVRMIRESITQILEYLLHIWQISLLILIITILAFGIFHILKIRNSLAKSRNIEWDKNFKIMQAIFYAKVRNENDISYGWRYTIKPKRKLRNFRWRFTWSGDGAPPISMANPAHTAVQGRESEGRYLDIDLGRTIDKNCIELVEWRCDPGFVNPPPLPYLAFYVSSISFPRHNTHMIVKFNEQVDITSIYKREYFDFVPSVARKEEYALMDNERVVHWKLPVTPGAKFHLDWTYGKETPNNL